MKMKKLLLPLVCIALFSCGTTTHSSPLDDFTSGGPHNGPSTYPDPQAVDTTPVTLEDHNFADSFYNPDSWVGMTKNNGESNDYFGKPTYDEENGLTFNNSNAAIDLGDMSNASISFNIYGNNDWNLWLRSSSYDNNANNSFRIECQYNVLRIKTSFSGNDAVAYVPAGYNYKVGEWNRFDFKFTKTKNTNTVEFYLNYVPVKVKIATNYTNKGAKVINGNLTLEESNNFQLGNYLVLKVWDDEDIVRIKRV